MIIKAKKLLYWRTKISWERGLFSWSIQEKSSPGSVVRSQGIGNGERGMVEKDSALGTRHLALETGNGERALSAGIIPARN